MRRWRMLTAVIVAAVVLGPATAAGAKKAPPAPSYPACATFLNGGGVTDQSKVVQWVIEGLTQQADANAPSTCTVNGTPVTYRLRVQQWGCTGCDSQKLSPDDPRVSNIDDVSTSWSPTPVTCADGQGCSGTYDAISWTIDNPAITTLNPSVNYCLRLDSYVIPAGSTTYTHVSSLPSAGSGIERACFQSGGSGGGSGYWG